MKVPLDIVATGVGVIRTGKEQFFGPAGLGKMPLRTWGAVPSSGVLLPGG